MHCAQLLADAFERIKEVVHDVTEGMSPEDLVVRVDAEANSVAWLVWHLSRVQDDHVAAVAGVEQAWTAGGWARRFALPLEVGDIGYGHDSAQVAQVRADAGLLVGYHDAVHEATGRFLAGLHDHELDVVVDERFDPPVTMAVRLVSVIADDLQHCGQAAYVRGLLERR
ncbi:MAG TPA: DUF664 domain-containing protein [Acidimicrobiales bacterium]|nr:DUF664 domain-containing protein [Acidimicrobiales bacterium]